MSVALDVDAVFCISLKERNDRRDEVLREAEKLDLTVEFILVDKDKDDPQRGCFHSHQKCAQIALSRGYNRVLILEDDVIFESASNVALNRLNNFIRKRDPEALYLGIILGRLWLTRSLGIARVRGSGTHAIILSRKACEKIVGLEYAGEGIDRVYSKIFKIYAPFPMIAYQQPTDLFPSDLDEFRKGTDKNEGYWRKVRLKQYTQAIKNLHKTLFYRG